MPRSDRIEEIDYAPSGKPLTGLKALAILLAFFGVVSAVDGAMIYSAVSTFRGEVEARPYERGLAYNRDIARARQQAARQWKVEASIARGASGETRLVVAARDAAGAQVTGAVVTATLAAPADMKRDARVALRETAPGRYEGAAAVPPGWRNLTLTVERDGSEMFRSKNRVLVE